MKMMFLAVALLLLTVLAWPVHHLTCFQPIPRLIGLIVPLVTLNILAIFSWLSLPSNLRICLTSFSVSLAFG